MSDQNLTTIDDFSENNTVIGDNLKTKSLFLKIILSTGIFTVCLVGAYFGIALNQQKKNTENVQTALRECNQNLEKYKTEFDQLEINCKLDLPDLTKIWNLSELETKTKAAITSIEALNQPIATKFAQRESDFKKSKDNYFIARESLQNLGYKKLPDADKIVESTPGTLNKLVLDAKMYQDQTLQINLIDQQFATLLQYKLAKFWSKYKIAQQIQMPIPEQVTGLIQKYSLDPKFDQQNLAKFDTPESAKNTRQLSIDLTQMTMLLTQNIYAKTQDSKDLRQIAARDDIPKKSVQFPILMYHRIEDLSKVPENEISDARKAISISSEVFTNQLDLLKAKGYESVDLRDVEQAILTKDTKFFDGKKVMITFDDGYPEHYDIAFKELKNRGFKGVFGIITETVKDKQLGVMPIMTWPKLKEMQSAGMQIISHTASHCALGSYKFLDGRAFEPGGDFRKCDLNNPKEVNYGKVGYPMMPLKQAEYEIVQPRQTILDKTGTDQPYIIFPYGAYNDQVLDIMFENGFKLGLGVGGGPNVDLDFPFVLNRVTVIGDTKVDDLKGWFRQI